VSPVRYELGSYIPEDDILHSRRCENLKSYDIRERKIGKVAKILLQQSFALHRSECWASVTEHTRMGSDMHFLTAVAGRT
jgi:hypothetical protein